MSVQPEEITDFLAKKLTSSQKRGENIKVEERGQIDVGNREILAISHPRSPAELANAQIRLAALALEHPDLTTDEEREAWLKDVLEYLGLDHKITRKHKKQAPLACAPYTGSERGYNVHLRTYTTPCIMCFREHKKMTEEHHRSMGIDHEGEIS